MTCTDFQYDGIRLSDLGYMICQFDESGGFASSTAGSQLTFAKVSRNSGRYYLLAGSRYDVPFETSISICKPTGKAFTVAEYAELMRWLNRPDFHDLYIGYDDAESEYDDIHFRGTFNVDKVEFRGKLIGFDLTFTSDGPFAYGEQRTYNFTLNGSNTYTIYEESDEIGYVYPDSLVVTCTEDGDLRLTNSIENRSTSIENVSANEALTFEATVSTLTSSDSSHAVMNDFNFTFFRLANTLEERANVISSNIACTVALTYTPRRKVVF